MDIFKAAEQLMAMDDGSWQQHANPLSIFTRFTCLPLIALAIWSRAWIGEWSLLPLSAALLWTWLNPRLFGPPTSFDNWASRGVLGERIFLNRAEESIAEHHVRMAYILTSLSAIGTIILTYGLIVLDLWAVLCGLFMSIGPKVWFVDRMVWIWFDQQSPIPNE